MSPFSSSTTTPDAIRRTFRTGRYHFVEDYAFILDGEMWYYDEGDIHRKEYRKGDVQHLTKGIAKGFRMEDRAWILEYVRGPVPTMLPFGVADTLFSTLDFRTLFRTFAIYTRHLLRSVRKQR